MTAISALAVDDHAGTLEIFSVSVSRFFDEHADTEAVDRWRENGMVDRELWRSAGKAGLLAPSAPEAFGGAGGDFRYELVVLEEVARRGLEGFGLSVHSGIAAPYVFSLASDDQKRRWAPGVVSGEKVLALAMSEPGAGSDLKGMRTSAVRDGDHYVINGQKTFISNGQQADLIILACKTGQDRISLVVVEADSTPGFSRGRNLTKMGREAQDTSELFFDEARVPVANLLGPVEGMGFDQMIEFLPQERLVLAAMGQTMMERALKLTVEYVRQRTAFTKAIIDFQHTKFKLAEAKTQIAAGRAFVDQAIEKHLRGQLSPTEAAMVKLWVSETQWKVIDDCLQLFGGYGYMDEYPISRMLRDARIDRIHGGTSEILKTIIAKSL